MRLRIATLAIGFLLAVTPFAPQAEAARGDSRSQARSASHRSTPHRAARSAIHHGGSRRFARSSRASYRFSGYSSYGGISCVPYARSVTGMAISGNGGNWWENAAGRYARSQRPQAGSILSFPGSAGMRLGHVAVVSRVVQPRMIEINHANWGGPGIRRGSVMHNVRVIDVSEDNSWRRVRVQVGWDSTTFGRVYPTDGFIHNRPAGSYLAEAGEAVRPATYVMPTEISDSRLPLAHPTSVRSSSSPGRFTAVRPHWVHQARNRRNSRHIGTHPALVRQTRSRGTRHAGSHRPSSLLRLVSTTRRRR
jgi:surface antigen